MTDVLAGHFAELKASSSGVSLQNHITRVAGKALQQDGELTVAQLQEVSRSVKYDELAWTDKPKPASVDVNASRNVLSLFKKDLPRADENGIQVSAGTSGSQAVVPNIVAESELLQWAGVSLGDDAAVRIALAIRKLGKEQDGLKSLRFWGRIQGLQADYYVAEGVLAEPKAQQYADLKPWDPLRRDVDKVVHHNQFKYFVCNSIGSQWTALGDVKFSEILATRPLKRYLTGNLTSPVSGFPVYPGNEAVFLRAQIARINSEAAIAPVGYYAITEPEDEGQSPELVLNAEFEAPDAEGLVEAGGWQHYYPGVPEVDPPKEEPEEEADPEEEPEDPEPPEPVALELREMGEDEVILARRACAAYEARVLTEVTVRNWPGAIGVAVDNKYVFFYNGYGQCEQQTGCFAPPMPPAIVADADEAPEQDDLRLKLDVGAEGGEAAGDGEEGAEE